MSRAVQTFADGSGELFGTVNALDQFAGALAANDQAVSRFMGDLGQVSQQLAGEKQELSAALANLADVLGKVERFVKGNRAMLTSDVGDLAEILKVVAGQKKALEAVLDVGPAAMGNLAIAFDPKSGSIGSRLNFQGNVQDLDNFLCVLVRNDQMPNADQACALFKQLLTPFEQQLQLPISAPTQPGQPQSGGATEVRYGSAPSATDLSELLGGAA
jgi:phospholipid/cholesterol/gamma-HCH transport system substrate-binding protein